MQRTAQGGYTTVMKIVFDIGGTNTRIAGSKDGKNISTPVMYETPRDFSSGIEQFVRTAKEIAAGETIDAVAGGIAGPLDKEKSLLTDAANLPDWNQKPLKRLLEEKLSAPVILENDTAMWGLGEAMHGKGKNERIVVYLTVSTGVGGCRIVDKAIDDNAFGFEPGHHIIEPNGPECGCGGRGHLEALISGAAVQKKFDMHPRNIIDPRIWSDIEKYLAIGLFNTSVFWSPDIIIFGGSMMRSISLKNVEKELHRLNTVLPTLPKITQSTLGETGGLLGSLSRMI